MSVSAYTVAALLCRKILMHVGVAEGAKENQNFAHYVNYLEQNHYLPPRGKVWVDHIRDQGNEANHEIMMVSRNDAEILMTLTIGLLSHLYELPHAVPAPGTP
jgi:hypothetical protein